MPAAVALWALCLLGAACASGGAGGGPGPGGGSRGVGAPATPVVINPAANTFLGAVVALRSRGAGLFGCGPRTHEGQATLDALQALSDAVNSDQPALPTIPKGVSLGMRVFDHCGRPRVAVSQLADMLPELGPGGPPPGPPASAPGLRTVGILDGAGLTRTDADADLEVRHALAAAMVPVAAVDSSHLVQPMQRAQAMVAALQRLEWRRFVVVRGADAYSDDLWQALAQLAGGLRAADLCVDSVETFVPDGPSGPSRTGDNNNGQEVLDVVTDAAVAGLPVVVLLPRGALRPFLDALREALSEADMPPAAPAALMLLLSDLVALEDAPLLPRGATIYSLATSTHGPDAVKVLEALMPGSAPAGDSLSAALRRDALLAAAQPVLGLALALRRSWRDKCPGKASGACPPWAAMSRPEFLSAYFAPLVAATARGERALEPGWEPRWAALLLPPDDLTLYRYLPDDALPGKHSVRAVLRASSVAVAANATGQTAAITVLDPAFQPEEVGVCATRPSAHSAAECERTCLPLHRPSRTAGGRRIESWANYQDNHLQRDANPDHPDSERPEVLESDEQHAAADRRHAGLGDDFLRLAESPQGAYLMLMLPLRRGPSNGETVLDCPAEVGDDAVDVVAVRRVEAFLWALRRLNQQLAREAVAGQAGPGQPLQLGALLADTCSSSLRAMTLAAKLRTPGQDQDGAERVLAVVNALPLPSARLAADILAERNVTSIATAQLLHANASSSSPYQLQVDLPLAHMVEAMVQTLRQLGWSYVSVVRADGEAGVDATADHVRGKDMFVEAAARAGICVALEVTLPRSSSAAQEEAAVGRLLGARAAGARAAIVWGSAAGVRALFRAVTRAIAQGSLRREDVFWLLASPDGDARDVLSEFGNVLAGAAVFSPQRRGVAEFQHFLQQETAAADARGSGPAGGVTGSDHELRWLRRYQEQCGAVGAVCAADEAAAVAGDWAVVQAVQALGAALAELRPCPSDDGSASSEASVEASAQPAAESPWPRGGEVCVADAPPRPLDAALADALRWTPSPRADGPIGAEFRFSPDGAGQLAVDVDNFRRRPAAARSRSLGDVHFQKVGTFLNGKLTSLDGRGPDSGGQGLVAYKDTGEEVRVASLTSQCGGSLGSCHRCRQQRGRPNSALGDWLVVEPPTPPQQQASEPTVYMLATIDVHEPSSNPLQCGQEISPRGVEQLEAFLWAVDQVNSNLSGLRVGAVAVDSCGSAARTSRLVAELLAEQANRVLQAEAEAGDAEPEVPDAAQDGALAGPVVAVLAGGATPVAAPALEAAAALGLPSVAPAARGPAPHRKTHPPYPLLLGPSNSAVAAGVVTLLGRLRWSCAAALYLQDAVDHEETFRQVESLARASNISVRGVPVAASAHSSQAGALAALRGALLQARGGGGRVAVLLLLPAWAVDAALRAAAALEDEGLWVPEDAALLAAGLEGLGGDGLAALLAHSRQTLGALVLRSRAALVLQFERHFRRLSLDANERDPWFAEFWSSVFHCRGSACRDGPGPGQHGLDAYQMQTGPDTANTINAVLAMGHALQTVRRELCPDGSPTGTGASRGARGPCRGMAALGRVKARLLEVAPRMAFVGAGPNAVAFDASGENTNVALEVLNVQMSAHSKAAVAVPVAEVGPSGALTGLDPDSTRAYVGAHREPVDLLSASPPVTCPGSDGAALATAATPTASSEVTGAGRPEPHAKYLMELPGVGAAGQPAPALLVLLAAHGPATSPGRSGKDAFHCGPLDADAVCQLAGAMFAVDRANRNASLLEGQAPKLGMVALDTCGQPGRAYSSLFTLLSHPDRRSVPVAALVLDEAAPPMVGPLLDMQAIARLDDPGHPAALQGSRSGQLAAVHAGPEALSRALLDVAVALQTQSAAHAEPRAAIPGATTAPLGPAPLVVIHGSSAHARALARHLESASLARCPAAAQPQPGPPGATATPPPAAAHHGPGCLSAVLPRPIQASVAGDNSRSGAQYLLSTLAAQSVVILALDSVDDARALLLSAQSAAVPRLVFLVALPGGHAKPLTADGHSVLSLVADATVVPSPAGGRDEALDAAFRDWLQALQELQPTATPPTMPPAWANSIRDSPCDLDSDADGQWSRADMMRAVERVARAVRWAAANASAADSAADPAADSASALPSRVSRFLQAEAAGEATEEPAAVAQVDTFRLWRGDEALGSWSPDGSLALDADLGLLALDELSVAGPGARSRPTLFHNLQSVWAVALLALALLGILATLVIAVFFLSAAAVSKTPISGGAGTSVLGYLILLGLLLLHAAVLALVLAPAEVTCGARRMLPALAYALIFAAMFLKVLTTWRVCDRKGGLVRPGPLVLRALALAAPQVLISAGWLALVPPSVHRVGPASWQCYSLHAASQAPHLLLSLAYTCLLMVATAVLALLCSSKEELLEEGTMLRQESRWILVSAVAVAVQLGCWGLAVVAAPLAEVTDMLAASVHALTAATLLLCLFLPKLRLYLRLRRDARNTAAIAASAAARSAVARSQPIYGISHFQPFGGKLNPAFDAPSTDMSLGESASRSASDHGSHSGSDVEGDIHYRDPLERLERLEPLDPLERLERLDPTQVVPSSLYSIDMFSSQDSGSQVPPPGPVIVAMATGDGRGSSRGTLKGTLPHPHTHRHPSLFGTVRGGTLRSVQALVQGGTVRIPVRSARSQVRGPLHGTVRGPHFLPGSNEFTAPHRSSSMLLLPGQESISYM